MHRYRSNICAWGSSFQWFMLRLIYLLVSGFMGIIGGSTRANRPNRRCRGRRLLGATCGLLKKHGWALIRVWALNRDNMVHQLRLAASNL